MNSSFINKGDIFLVCKENEKYVFDAIKKGASKIITQTNNNYDIKTEKTSCVKNTLYENYKDRINNLKLIGVTGTNGKTTTCYLIYQMLNMMNIKTSYIGTIGFYLNDEIRQLDNTTPSMDLIYNLLLDSYENGCEVVVMEVSSHALKQDRIFGLLFDAIAVTNITFDHLDYHKTKEDYIRSKKIITTRLKNKKVCILNKYDKYYKEFINKENNNIIIGEDIKVKKVINNINNTYLKIKENNNYSEFYISLIGNYNVYNFLMAYEIIKELNLYKQIDFIKLKAPKGRLEKIEYKNNVIFIDYAHTPDAVLNVLKTMKKIKNKGIITIIGCGGNRDKLKRPIMGRIATDNSKYVIFTNDNPRLEDEKQIISDITKNLIKDNYEIIYDRYSAIKKGISMLNNNMILLILGKGHEDYQVIGNKKIKFSDKESVIDIIS